MKPTFSIKELEKAISALKIAIQLFDESSGNDNSHQDLQSALRDACIQRFEFCVELSWKTSVRALGLDIKSPNTAIRDMARNNLIDSPDIWFQLLVARNKSSHTYDEEVAKAVYQIALNAVPQFEALFQRLQDLNT